MKRFRTAAIAAGGTLAATLALTTAPALAAYTAQIDGDTLNVTGNGAADALALRLAPGDPATLQIDVGDDGTAGPDKVRVTRDGDEAVVSGLAAQTRVSGSDPGVDTLRVNTLDGRDTVTVAADLGTLINPVVDLGAGQ